LQNNAVCLGVATRLIVQRAGAFLPGCLAALVCCWSPALNAQTLRFQPHADLSLPTRMSLQKGSLRVEQRVGLAIGARLTISFNPRLDVVTGASYSPGYAVLHGARSRFNVTAGNHLLTGTADARYWLSPPGRRLSWQVHTGVGLVFGGEPAYQDLFESSTVSGLVGTAVRYQIGRLMGIKLVLRDRLYRLRLGHLKGGGTSSSPFRVSFGLDLPFHTQAP
jgi:hypothetical protein